MNTRVLEYLVAVADERSVTRAAEKFYLSQPSLSRHIANAEKEMGVKLFVRAGGELRLTDAGTVYINGARAILAAERQGMEQIARLRTKEKPSDHSHE